MLLRPVKVRYHRTVTAFCQQYRDHVYDEELEVVLRARFVADATGNGNAVTEVQLCWIPASHAHAYALPALPEDMCWALVWAKIVQE